MPKLQRTLINNKYVIAAAVAVVAGAAYYYVYYYRRENFKSIAETNICKKMCVHGDSCDVACSRSHVNMGSHNEEMHDICVKVCEDNIASCQRKCDGCGSCA